MHYDLTIVEGTDTQFLKHQILIQISYWVNLIPRDCAIADWLAAYRHVFWFLTKWTCFLMFYCISNCFKRQYLSFCLYWVAACTCATVRNIKNSDDNVRGKRGAYLAMNFQNLLSRRKINWRLLIVTWFVTLS